ncbi:hypothetical protein Q7P37_002614 [Cladosporium fusiforme]
MGRTQNLERLALGRSAFQHPSANTATDENDVDTAGSQETNANTAAVPGASQPYVQQYDAKGRPFSPETEAQNAKLRHASNEVLALVGVVERKDSADARMQLDLTLKRAMREHSLISEDNRGTELRALADVVSWFVSWWPAVLTRRIQVGIYSKNTSFADILRSEANSILNNGWRRLLLGLLPGAGVAVLHKVLWQFLALIVEEGIGALQNKIVASKIRRRKAKRLIRSLTVFTDILLVAIDMLLLPLEIYSIARQLNIAPPTPWRPLLTTLLPSYTRAAYSTMFSSPASFLTTSAPYLIGYGFLTRDPSPEAPAFNDMTSYRLPSISEPISSSSVPPFSTLQDPFGAILYSTWSIRQKFLRFVGWDMYETQRPGSTHGWETDIHYESPDEFYDLGVVTHRSTALARLPATLLGMRIDMFLVKILLLPAEALVMRKVASAYFASGMPLTRASMEMNAGSPALGTWSLVSTTSGWPGLSGYMSQLGLSMAVNLGVEMACLACMYALVRKQGTSGYGWGGRGHKEEASDDRSVQDAR